MKIEAFINYDDAQDTWNVLTDKEPSKPWVEYFSLEDNCLVDAPKGLSAKEYAQLVVNFFNDTLKPGEMRRRLVKAEWVWEPTK